MRGPGWEEDEAAIGRPPRPDALTPARGTSRAKRGSARTTTRTCGGGTPSSRNVEPFELSQNEARRPVRRRPPAGLPGGGRAQGAPGPPLLRRPGKKTTHRARGELG